MVKCISGFNFPEEVQDLPLAINTTDLGGGGGVVWRKKKQTKKHLSRCQVVVGKKTVLSTLLTLEPPQRGFGVQMKSSVCMVVKQDIH